MGDDLDAVVLFESAKPGDTVTVAMKMLHTTKVKSVFGAALRVEAPASRPDPQDLRLEFLTAARLVPSLAPGDTASMAALDSAIAAVDAKALDGHDQAGFDASLKAAHAKLEPLKPLEQQLTVPPDRTIAYRCGMAVAVDRNGGRGEAHVRNGAAVDARVSAVHVFAVGRGLQRVAGAEVSRHE